MSRPRGLPVRRKHREHAGQSRFPERADAAYSVCAVDDDGAPPSLAHRAAVDQQILYSGSQAEELVHQVVRRSRAHGLCDLVDQSRRRARRQAVLATICSKGPSRPSTRSNRRPGRPRSMPSDTASAARWSRARLPTWRRPTTNASPPPRSSRHSSIFPMSATSRSSSTRPQLELADEAHEASRLPRRPPHGRGVQPHARK